MGSNLGPMTPGDPVMMVPNAAALPHPTGLRRRGRHRTFLYAAFLCSCGVRSEDAVAVGMAPVRRGLNIQHDTALTAIPAALNPSNPHKPDSKGARSTVISRLAAAIGNISKPNIT